MAASDSGTLRQLARGGRNSARVGEAQRAHRRSQIQHGSLNIRDTRTDGKRLPRFNVILHLRFYLADNQDRTRRMLEGLSVTS
jgi:hypothetical protein